jgi:hypothetical protein
LVVIAFMSFVPSSRFDVGAAALVGAVMSAGMAVATAAKALPAMTSRREAPAVWRGLAVVILTLALVVALVREALENPCADKRLIASGRPPAQLCDVKNRYFFRRASPAELCGVKSRKFALPSVAARWLLPRFFIFQLGRHDFDSRDSNQVSARRTSRPLPTATSPNGLAY